MAFNLGAPRLAKFNKMRAAIVADDWQAAAAEALASKMGRPIAAAGGGNCAVIARLVLAERGKFCRFGQGVKKRRVGAVLGGNALECAVGGLRIMHRFGDTAVNRIITL